MKFEQTFNNYKIIVDFDCGSMDLHVVELDSGYCWLHIINDHIMSCRMFYYDVGSAFDLANVYQEALAIANTNNLTVDLLFELGYTEVK